MSAPRALTLANDRAAALARRAAVNVGLTGVETERVVNRARALALATSPFAAALQAIREVEPEAGRGRDAEIRRRRGRAATP